MNATLVPAVLLVLPALAAAACRAIGRGRLCAGLRPGPFVAIRSGDPSRAQ